MAKQGKGKGKAGAVFTAAMVVCCIGLYLLGTQENKDVKVNVDVESTPAPAAEKQRAYPTEEVFFERAKEFGLASDITAGDMVGNSSRKYTISREDLDDAELVLSKRNGGICSFTVTVPRAPEPDSLDKQPSAVEISLYEQRLAAYELESSWIKDCFTALLSAIDIMGEVTYGDITSMLSLISQTVKDGKDRDVSAGDFETTASIMDDKLYITVSIKE